MDLLLNKRSVDMGCWNGTCLLSGLNIDYGDSVKAMFVLSNQNMSGTGTVYPYEWYSPLFLPFSGCYDSYGRVDKIDDSDSKKTYDALMAGVCESPDVDTSSDHELNRFKMPDNMEGLVHQAERGYLGYEYHDKKRPVGLMMAHEHIWNEAVERIKKCPARWGEGTMEGDITKKIQDHKPDMFELEDNPDSIPSSLLDKVGLGFGAWVGMSNVAVGELMDLIFISIFMHKMRKRWTPPTSCGCQHENEELTVEFNQVISDFAALKIAEKEEDHA